MICSIFIDINIWYNLYNIEIMEYDFLFYLYIYIDVENILFLIYYGKNKDCIDLYIKDWINTIYSKNRQYTGVPKIALLDF